MKKVFIPVLLTSLVALSACSQSVDKENAASTDASTTEITTNSATNANPLPTEEKGEGTVYLSGPGGTTENGETLSIFDDGDTAVMQIGINTSDVDGNKLSYIYVDGSLISKEQFGNSQSSINLKDDMLKKGTHTVNLVQYSDDSETGDIITNKISKYEIKEQ